MIKYLISVRFQFKLPTEDPIYQTRNTLGKMEWALKFHRKHQKRQDIRVKI